MKKLLLVLLVVALASFLLVGCLPGTTPDDDDDDGNGDDVIVPATMTFAKEYTNVGGITFIPCGDTVTVAFPSPVEADYVVYIAVKEWVPAAGSTPGYYTYVPQLPATPNAGRTVWTLKLTTLVEEAGCQPICLVAFVKHPCCPGEEVAQRIVTLDCTAPVLDLFVKFTDCADVCVTPDPCVPAVPGAYMEWTSRITGLCATDDCCKDACSGVNGWSLVADADACLGPCDTESGNGCPVEGALECGCLIYDDPATTANEGIHYVDFSFEDKVGNAVKSTWKLTFDTDSLVTFEVGSRTTAGVYVSGTEIFPTVGWYTVYNDCAVAE